MYVISIRKIENRRSGTDRRQSTFSSISKLIVNERRESRDRRGDGDRRDMKDRRSAKYYIISDLQKEKLDEIMNFKH